MEELSHALELRGVRYGWGSKAKLTHEGALSVKHLDCSGFAQLAIWYAAGIKIVEGTAWDQFHEIRDRPLCAATREGEDYSAACEKWSDSVLMGFIKPTALHAGHVWFVHQGRTFESHGGVGVKSRSWNTPVLMREVSRVLVLHSD